MTKSPSPSVDEVAEDTFLHNTLQLLFGHRNYPPQAVYDLSKAFSIVREASLVSPPKAGEGEPAYWHNGAGQVMEHAAREALRGTSDEDLIGRFDEPLYANHETRGDGVRVTDQQVEDAIRAADPNFYTAARESAPSTLDRAKQQMRRALEAALPPLGDGRAEIVEAARMARTRLMAFADAANAGEAQAGGRELSRKIWAAFAEFDALSLEQGEKP